MTSRFIIAAVLAAMLSVIGGAFAAMAEEPTQYSERVISRLRLIAVFSCSTTETGDACRAAYNRAVALQRSSDRLAVELVRATREGVSTEEQRAELLRELDAADTAAIEFVFTYGD